jgi:hypothetical protein
MDDEKPRGPGDKSAIVENYSQDDLVEEFKDLDQTLLKQLDHRGLEDSLDVLTQLEEIIGEIRDELARIDDEHQADVKRDPAATDSIDLAAAALALMVARDGLGELGIESHALNRLFNGLQDLHNGASPAGMFLALESNSRRPDAGNVQIAKGVVAAIIQAKQKVGKLGRQEAAKWTLKNLSASLRERISVKPITERTLIEWLDRYGGKSGDDDPGRQAFLEYSRLFLNWPDIKKDDCASLTNGLAKKLPSLKRTKHRKPLS